MIRTQYSKQLESFLDFIRQCEADMKEATETEILMEKQTQDILHYVELEEPSLFDYICLGLATREIRKKRRKAKNTRNALALVMEWTAANRRTIDSLQQLLGKLRKEERIASQRFYINRTDIIEKILKNHDK